MASISLTERREIQKYEVEDAVRAIRRFAEVKANKKLFAAAKKKIRKEREQEAKLLSGK